MTRPDLDSNSTAPFGTEPRRGSGPAYLYLVLFGICLGVLVFLAAFYPAR